MRITHLGLLVCLRFRLGWGCFVMSKFDIFDCYDFGFHAILLKLSNLRLSFI